MESKVHMQNIKKLWFQNNILLDILPLFFNKLLVKHSIEIKAFGSYNSYCGWAQANSSGVFKTILCIHFARNTLRFECAQNVLCRWRHSAWNTGASKIRSVGNWTVCTLYCHLILLLVWFVCVKMLGKSYIAHGSGNEVSERASEYENHRMCILSSHSQPPTSGDWSEPRRVMAVHAYIAPYFEQQCTAHTQHDQILYGNRF